VMRDAGFEGVEAGGIGHQALMPALPLVLKPAP